MPNDVTQQLLLQIDDLVNKLYKKYNDLTPFLHIVSAIIKAKFDENFRFGGRWDGDKSDIGLFSGGNQKWKPHAKYTIKEYEKSNLGKTPVLIRTGQLRNSIEVFPKGKTSVAISARTPYARIQNFGGNYKTQGGNYYYLDKKGKRVSISEKRAESRRQNKKPVYQTKPRFIIVPPRPYLTLTQEDLQEIFELLTNLAMK